MKRYLLLLCCAALITSCKNTWDSETKEMFHQSCMEEAVSRVGSTDKAKAYCDCTLERTMKKYPDYKDALQHLDSVVNNPDLVACKELLK